MTLITWDDSLSVDIKEIDEQHQKLFNLINRLDEVISSEDTFPLHAEVLVELMDYTDIHFTLEENYFEQYQYPDMVAHKKEHNYFKNKLSEFQQSFFNVDPKLLDKIKSFLRDWLIKHIQGTDKKYSSFFIEKGLS